MIPNLISLLRIFLMPLFLYLIFQPERSMKFAALIVFSVASLTDFFDGWSARKLKQESELGKFLDPLADKVLVISTLVAFLLIDYLIPLWMIIVIIGRDVLVTVMRYIAVKKGMSIRTSRFGKIKTAFQMISILVIIMIFIVRGANMTIPEEIMKGHYMSLVPAWSITVSNMHDKWLIAGPYWLMLVVTILTAWSGIRYLVFNWRVLLPPYKGKDK
ncbi:MAG TPA: CDP-diacylglycerol--glycerol-3-phosphate 3-phosphatidyltransferase [Spirochaetota bacterium]|nr:CDP-diacylglycerol--glycerol-3-phosphate 3-phosphatidyltransferase [Spirochaetota bacterium]HPW50822.1 CDP-diacylglycerol--glycerol-3-phosphate 3-phosphatidyltransferase [Spirochaetota bacterium]